MTYIVNKHHLTKARPISLGWTIGDSPDHCINEEAHLKSANIINTVTDFIVVLLPMRTIMALELSSKHRVVVIALFGIGLFASATGIARTYFTWALFTAADYDQTWRGWYLWLTSLLELHLGIVSITQTSATFNLKISRLNLLQICASVPATRPFFTSYLVSKLGSTRTRQKSLALSESAIELRQRTQEPFD